MSFGACWEVWDSLNLIGVSSVETSMPCGWRCESTAQLMAQIRGKFKIKGTLAMRGQTDGEGEGCRAG